MFRYIPCVVVEFVAFRGSFHYLHNIDRHIIRISLILGVLFPFTNIIDILMFDLLEFYFNRSNSTSNLYKMSTEDIEFLKYKFHCISIGLILNAFFYFTSFLAIN